MGHQVQGIPKKPGVEEQMQQSALIGIYSAVIPEVIILDVPNSNNVVVVIRVDESVRVPHAIQNSTRAYIRTGSITQPYELADIDCSEIPPTAELNASGFFLTVCKRDGILGEIDNFS